MVEVSFIYVGKIMVLWFVMKIRTYTFRKNKKRLIKILARNIISPSIVQQPVPPKYGERVLSFRIYLQKKNKKEWDFHEKGGIEK